MRKNESEGDGASIAKIEAGGGGGGGFKNGEFAQNFSPTTLRTCGHLLS